MRLLIVSNMSHYLRDGQIVGWGPTVNEIDQLSTLFDDVRHVACVHGGEAPPSALPYASPKVVVVGVSPTGGQGLSAKLRVLWESRRYAVTIWRELASADCVHVRGPANISLLALLLLAFRRLPRMRWAKYAGNWQPRGSEAFSYRLQRWLLRRRVHRGLVTVNGEWAGQQSHVRSFLNPCLSDAEVREGARIGAAKGLVSPVRLLFVGRVESDKGCGRAIELVKDLKDRGVSSRLDVVGDGPERGAFEALAAGAGLASEVRFWGWLPRSDLARLYSEAHFLVLPSVCSEGWPKVLSEGMAYGVVPLASTVSCIPQYLAEFRTGRSIEAYDRAAFADAVEWYLANGSGWKVESTRAMEAASRFSYTNYLRAVHRLLSLDENGVARVGGGLDAAEPRKTP